jgi:chemotaxis protein CheC
MLLNETQRDVLTEVVNIGVGRAAAALSNLVELPISLQVPRVHVYKSNVTPPLLDSFGSAPVVCVGQAFQGTIRGSANHILSLQSACLLAEHLMREKVPDKQLTSDHQGVLVEVGNIVLNNVMGTFVNILGGRLEYSIPKMRQINIPDLLASLHAGYRLDDSYQMLVEARFAIPSDDIQGMVLLVFELKSLESLLVSLDSL